MTFNNSPWAIDGALVEASQARTETYANSSGNEGVVSRNDLKVSQLTVAGNGLLISAGAALVLNRYQTTPNQMYVVTNPGGHTVGSSSMPATSTSDRTFIVAIAVGDPEFSQIGHPFMLSTDPPAGSESTFDYVRPVVVLESDFNNRSYPAVPLARLELPANTSTITNAMLTDIREISRPRRSSEVANVTGPSGDNPLNGGGGNPGVYERFPNVNVLTVKIPDWAVKAKIIGYVEGLKLLKAGDGDLRVNISGESLSTPITDFDENAAGAGNERRSYNLGGEIDVRSVAGQTKTFIVQGRPNATADKGALVADGRSSVGLFVQFEERPI